MTEKYRSDIDGLRAIAVISVVLYHAGVRGIGGGYVGVDIFFVISGYLITRYVNQRIEAGRFSIVEFYERRVRRIMPALFFLLIVASALAYFTLLPIDLHNFAKSQIATTLFVPNIFFFRQSGYFDASAKLKPLLHMWSLGVEEQFYILLPLTMVFVARWGRRGTQATLYGAMVASFVLSVLAVMVRPAAAFYLVPFRAWELLLGSVLGVSALPLIRNRRLCQGLATLGIALTLLPCFLYSRDTPFPGLAALVPCVGAALVICANEAELTPAGRLLSWRPFVGIGLISYSLYLWHWPMLVFGEDYLGRPLNKAETAIAVLISLVAATASWKFVEQPFRRRVVGSTRPALFSSMVAVAAAVVIAGTLGIVNHGLPQRWSPQALRYAAARTDRDSEIAACKASEQQIKDGKLCRLGSSTSPQIDFIVWGDSHAEAIAPAFRVLANQTKTVGWLVTHPGCAPLLGVRRLSGDASHCDRFNEAVISAIERYNIRTVFLAGRWEVNALGRTNWETSEGFGGVVLLDASSHGSSPGENQAVFERGLTRTLERLHGGMRSVALVMDVPNTAIDTPIYLAKAAVSGTLEPDVRIDIPAHGGRIDSLHDLLVRLCSERHVLTIDLASSLCTGSECLVAKDGQSLYRDDHHLSLFAALQLVDLIRPTFERALTASGHVVASAQPWTHASQSN